MRNNNNVRNSVFAILNGFDVAKFPDDSFKLRENTNNFDQIYERHFAKDNLVCKLFDIVEKHINPNNNLIERVILKCTAFQAIEIESIVNLVNQLTEYLGRPTINDSSKKDTLNKLFELRCWNLYWGSWNNHRINLNISRNAEIFELHITYPS